MNNNQFNNNYNEINECTSRGICSTSPILSALQEIIILFIEQSSFYILKLKAMGVENAPLILEVIRDLSGLISINEFSDKQLYEVTLKEYSMLKSLEKIYIKMCKKMNKSSANILKLPIEFSEDITLPKAISQGEKVFLINYKKFDSQTRNTSDIILAMLKSISYYILMLNEFGCFDNNSINLILKSLNLLNKDKYNIELLNFQISKLARCSLKLRLLIARNMLKIFGEISKVDVSHSTRAGKAILVSGTDFFALQEVLSLTKDKDIDVYTHSNLLIAHALSGFKKFKNLAGHYGTSTESSIVDFATFPGAILLAGSFKNTSDYLYRGRIFSKDYVVHSGVIKLNDNDYSQLISSALFAKGFKKGRQVPKTILGYDQKELKAELTNIAEKLRSGEIKRLFIVGTNTYSESQKDYFNQMFANIHKDEYVISFSHKKNKKNVLNINVANFSPFVTLILTQFLKLYPIDDKIVFMITTCDIMTVSSIVMLHSLNARNLYISPCPPYMLKPSVSKMFKNKYGIKTTSAPIEDLEKIRKQ